MYFIECYVQYDDGSGDYFFFNDTAATVMYSLCRHGARPICVGDSVVVVVMEMVRTQGWSRVTRGSRMAGSAC